MSTTAPYTNVIPIKAPPAEGTMKAALFHAPGDVRYEDTPIPEVSAGEILVKIERALTCGTDLKCYRRGHPVLLKSFPSPFGHEFAGIVAKVGSNISTFEPGHRVVAANSAPCFDCYCCHRGQHNLCDNLDLLNGAYAQYLKIPERIVAVNTHVIPDDLSFEKAAFAEPLSVSIRGVEEAGVKPGDRVAILGLGPIGLLLAKVAKLKGAHVTGFGRNPLKLSLSKSFAGIDDAVNLKNISSPEEIRHHYTPDNRGFDVVIEAVGLPEMWQKAVKLTRRGGTVNLFGGCPADTTVTLSTRRMHYDEIRMMSLFHHTPAYFKKAVDMLSSHELDPKPLITDEMMMAQVPDALKRVEAGEAIKISLMP